MQGFSLYKQVSRCSLCIAYFQNFFLLSSVKQLLDFALWLSCVYGNKERPLFLPPSSAAEGKGEMRELKYVVKICVPINDKWEIIRTVLSLLQIKEINGRIQKEQMSYQNILNFAYSTLMCYIYHALQFLLPKSNGTFLPAIFELELNILKASAWQDFQVKPGTPQTSP